MEKFPVMIVAGPGLHAIFDRRLRDLPAVKSFEI
jgi:hypothetical protein